MTPEEKIAALVEHIKKEFPKGCKGVNCNDCVVHNTDEETIDGTICEMLAHIESFD